jgi:tRNA(Met) cytidine acetyltransferase
VLQNREWDAVADDLDRVSTRMTMRAFGDACEPLVEIYGTGAAKQHHEYWD